MAIMGYWKRGIPWTDAWVRRILLQGIPEFPWGYTSRIILGVSRPLSMYTMCRCVDGRAGLGVIPGARPMAEPRVYRGFPNSPLPWVLKEVKL